MKLLQNQITAIRNKINRTYDEAYNKQVKLLQADKATIKVAETLHAAYKKIPADLLPIIGYRAENVSLQKILDALVNKQAEKIKKQRVSEDDIVLLTIDCKDLKELGQKLGVEIK